MIWGGLDTGVEGQAVAARLQRHDDLFQGGVAGPLAQAVDGALDLARPALHPGQGVGDGQAQVVVAVGGEHHRVGARHAGDQVAEQLGVLVGIGCSRRCRGC